MGLKRRLEGVSKLEKRKKVASAGFVELIASQPLVGVCQERLSEDPITGCVFVFRSRRGTSIRLLSYDGQGYWLAQQRLSKGRFAWWPESTSAAKQLEAYEAQLLMVAGDVSRVRAAPMWGRVSALK